MRTRVPQGQDATNEKDPDAEYSELKGNLKTIRFQVEHQYGHNDPRCSFETNSISGC